MNTLLQDITLIEALCDEIEFEIDDELFEEFGEDGIEISEPEWSIIAEVSMTDDLTEGADLLSEGARRALKRVGKVIKRWYRCRGGQRDGTMVSDPKLCSTRKDPKKVRQGRKVAKQKRGIRVMKTKVAKRQAISRMVSRMNQRMSGK